MVPTEVPKVYYTEICTFRYLLSGFSVNGIKQLWLKMSEAEATPKRPQWTGNIFYYFLSLGQMRTVGQFSNNSLIIPPTNYGWCVCLKPNSLAWYKVSRNLTTFSALAGIWTNNFQVDKSMTVSQPCTEDRFSAGNKFRVKHHHKQIPATHAIELH